MCSLQSRWEQKGFRRTILFVTDEKALFYEPAASDDVRRFVVATIRNSMLEVAASVNCSQFKMQEFLSDQKIKGITSDAICYFRQCKFETLRDEAENLEDTDVYGEAIQKYPLAWTVLKRAASVDNGKTDMFEEVQEANSDEVGILFYKAERILQPAIIILVTGV